MAGIVRRAASPVLWAWLVGLTALALALPGCTGDPAVENPPATAAPLPASSPSPMATPVSLASGAATTTPVSGPATPSTTSSGTPAAPATAPAPSDGAPIVWPAGPMTAADFPAPSDRDLWRLARQLTWGGVDQVAPDFAPRTDWQVGEARDFWIFDFHQLRIVSRPYRLRAISDSAYWWVGDAVGVEADELPRMVDRAEASIFPPVAAAFATAETVARPEHRLHVVSGRIPGVGGYVFGSDQYPTAVRPYSNEVEGIYINTRVAGFDDDLYLKILTHELQHAILRRADESEATWLNEGLAELAVTLAGSQVSSIDYYLGRPSVSLVNWPDDFTEDLGYNYGAAALFAHYLQEHYAPEGRLQDLLAIEADGIAAVDQFLAGRGALAGDGSPATFHTVFADWMAANLLDAASGAHGYAGLDPEPRVSQRQKPGAAAETRALPQYGIHYVAIDDADDAGVVRFAGAGVTPLLATDVPSPGCWWSNRGDTASATLTLALTVPQRAADGAEPMLTYRYWHEIEEDWDYLYVAASTDGGAAWDILPASGTTDSNPLGNSYGHAYTGSSDGWQDGAASLAAYAGREALVRFHYITDDAINGSGFCVRDMTVAAGDGAPSDRGTTPSDSDATPSDSNAAPSGDWQADGFVPVNNRVQQDWIVWLLADGAQPSAQRMPLTWDAASGEHVGSLPVPAGTWERLVVAVAATAPATMEPGEYRLWVEPR